MKELYLFILARLKAMVPELKEIDFDMGQLDVLDENQRPIVLFPCALLDISFPSAEDESSLIQQVNAQVNVKLAFRVQYKTNSLAPASQQTSALSIFNIVDKSYKALQGYEDDSFGPLSRIQQSPDNNYPGIKIINLLFSTDFEDITANGI